MAFKTETIEPNILSLASRVVFFNLFLAILGVATCTLISGGVARGFALGFLIGVFNQYLCLQIARRGITMEPDRAKTFVTKRYFMRFALTALVLAVLISRALVNPWALVTGFGLSLFITITMVLVVARGEWF
jgi:hypothetical protein